MNDRLIERYESTVKELDFFDMNVWLDPFDRERFYPAPDFAGTVSQLRKKGIRRMLITSSECIMYDAKTGNYRVDYTLPIQIAGGLTFFVVMMVFFFREWRATRPRARQRQYPRGR